MDEKRPCVNFRSCGGYAEPNRTKCWCCIEAEEEIKAAQIEKQLEQQEKKPLTTKDVWKWK
jgi:hypothetical protein